MGGCVEGLMAGRQGERYMDLHILFGGLGFKLFDKDGMDG